MTHSVVLVPPMPINSCKLGSASKCSLLLDSFNQKFGRRNSVKSTASTRAAAELAVPAVPVVARSRSTTPNPLSNPSPATRRPDRPGMNAFTVPSNEPPPAYTPSPVDGSAPSFVNIPTTTPAAATNASGTEDKYAFLATFDTVILIDDSGSMAGRSWRETSQAIATIAPIVTRYDSDGIDLYFLNNKSADTGDIANGCAPSGYRNLRRSDSVSELMARVRPSGHTPTGQRLHQIFKPYLAKCEKDAKLDKETKPLNIIVITDGEASDEVDGVIIQAAKRLDKINAPPYQLGVQFFQVGNEPGAKEALERLDDELSGMVEGGVRDIVDTVTWTGGNSASEGGVGLTSDSILKVVLGSVVKRLDRQRASGEVRRP